MNKFIVIATCKEVLSEQGVFRVIHGGTKVVLVHHEWVDGATSVISEGEKLPKATRVFDTRQNAEVFACKLDAPESIRNTNWWSTWHPWYIQPSSWEVVEVEPIMEVVGYSLKGAKE